MTVTLTVICAIALIAFGGLMAATESALNVLSRDDIRDMAKTRRAKISLRSIADDLGITDCP